MLRVTNRQLVKFRLNGKHVTRFVYFIIVPVMFATVDVCERIRFMAWLSGPVQLPRRQPFEYGFIQYRIPIIGQL